MSDKPRDNGGPAFPQQMVETDRGRFSVADWGCGGMSLRDWFAGMALAGMMAEPRNDDWKNHVGIVAQTAYEQSDAMLTQRDKAEAKP